MSVGVEKQRRQQCVYMEQQPRQYLATFRPRGAVLFERYASNNSTLLRGATLKQKQEIVHVI
jgi:hypothetical protein